MKKKQMKTDVIVPCFNDGKYIEKVLTPLKQCSLVNRIIVVDDGSNLETKKILKKIKGIHLITCRKNRGKTAAVKTGLDASTTLAIALVDADLFGLKKAHVTNFLSQIDTDTSMILGVRSKENLIGLTTGIGVAYTGERIFWKKDLLKNLDIFTKTGYLLEPVLNEKFFYPEKTKIVVMNGVGQKNKVFKIGLKGLMNDFKMFGNYIQYLGIKEFTRQVKLGLVYQKISNKL